MTVNALALCAVFRVIPLEAQDIQLGTHFLPPGYFGGFAFHLLKCHADTPLPTERDALPLDVVPDEFGGNKV